MKISSYTHISLLLCIDDTMIFGHGSIIKMKKNNDLLNLYCNSIGMVINMKKYTLLNNEIVGDVQRKSQSIFPMQISDLDQGVKCLGFHLK